MEKGVPGAQWGPLPLGITTYYAVKNNSWYDINCSADIPDIRADGDQDGVVTFDESNRFHDDEPNPLRLDPTKSDSDEDAVSDKDEIINKYNVH